MVALRLLAPALLLPLGGCVAGMAASAVGLAADAAGPGGQNSKFMQAAARQACSAQAAQSGSVQVTSVTQAKDGEIVVLGTVQGTSGTQAFECSFVTTVTGFTLKPVQPGA
jgi:hypothetical protein